MKIFKMKLATMQGIKPINHGIVFCREDGFISKKGSPGSKDWTPVEDFGMYILNPIDYEDFPSTGSSELFEIFLELIANQE